ncbi:SAF domain-containing protein [Deinococcus sp. D7000]|nr:SAF domain-containing protein [Deinococcus sp. D7000]
MTLDDLNALEVAGVSAPEDVPAALANRHYDAGDWLIQVVGSPTAASRVLLAPQVLGEKPPRFGWMDAVIGGLTVSILVLIAMIWLAIDPPQAKQVTVKRDLPAYHRLSSDDIEVREQPRTKDSFVDGKLVAGRLITHALKTGKVLLKSDVTPSQVTAGSVVITVITASVPSELAVAKKLEVISKTHRSSALLLAQRSVEKSVQLDIVVAASDAIALAGQKVALILPTQ